MTEAGQPIGTANSSEAGAAPSRPLARVGRHGIVYAAGMLLSKAVAFVMLPVYTRYLTPADYGTLQLVEVTFEVVSIVAGSRLGAGIFHFYHKAADLAARRRLLATTLVLMIGTYFAATGTAFALAPALSNLVFRDAQHSALIRVGAAGLAFQSLLLVPLAYLQVRERSGMYVGANTAKLVVQLSLNIVFIVFMRLGAMGVLLSTFVANTLLGGILAAYLVRDVGLRLSREAARDVLRFGIPFVGTQIATTVSTYGDRYFLQRSASVAAVGIYGLAYQFGFLLAWIGYVPFQSIWDPIRFEVAKRADRDEVYARAFVYYNVVYLTTAVGIAVLVRDVLRVMSDPAYLPAADIVPVILLAYVFQGWTEFQNLGVLIRERTAVVTWANWIAAAVAVVLYALLIPAYQGLGAAVATVAAFAVRHAIVYVAAQRLWPVRYRWGPVMRLVALAALVVVASELIRVRSVTASLAVRLGLLSCYSVGVWIGGILSEADRSFVKRLGRRPREALSSLAG
jgi:O-antigen/teichoic acid export membrane protein